MDQTAAANQSQCDELAAAVLAYCETNMSVPWRSALPSELVGEVTACLVEFLRGMLGITDYTHSIGIQKGQI